MEGGHMAWLGIVAQYHVSEALLTVPEQYRPCSQHPSLVVEGGEPYRPQMVLVKQLDGPRGQFSSAGVAVVMKVWASVWSKRMHTKEEKAQTAEGDAVVKVQKVRKAARHPCGFPVLSLCTAKLRLFYPTDCGFDDDGTLTFTALPTQHGFQGNTFYISNPQMGY